MKMILEELIEEVRKYPCLWNKGLEEYRNQNTRGNAWVMISGELNTQGNVQTLFFYLLVKNLKYFHQPHSFGNIL